jgi:hypothetical protein
MMKRRRPFGFKGQLEMADDPVDGLSFFDKRDDSHLGTGCGQIRTSDCRSQDNAQPPPGLPDGNTFTLSRTDPHILEGIARNNKKTPGKTPCVPDIARGRSLP